jgi:hypothetical protein
MRLEDVKILNAPAAEGFVRLPAPVSPPGCRSG